MIVLLIKRQDGSLYWREHFNTMSDLNKWLDEEKTRKYWNPSFVTEIIDNRRPKPTPEEIAAEQAKQNAIIGLKQRLSILSDAQDLTASELKEAMMKLIKMLKLQNHI